MSADTRSQRNPSRQGPLQPGHSGRNGRRRMAAQTIVLPPASTCRCWLSCGKTRAMRQRIVPQRRQNQARKRWSPFFFGRTRRCPGAVRVPPCTGEGHFPLCGARGGISAAVRGSAGDRSRLGEGGMDRPHRRAGHRRASRDRPAGSSRSALASRAPALRRRRR